MVPVLAALALAWTLGGTPTAPPAEDSSCVACHVGIEPMHPEAELGCVDCHGGDASAARMEDAHVAPRRAPVGDERVVPLDWDPAYRRFVNPMDLRVAAETCGDCHAETVERVRVSLHGTTAGHLSDGFYEVGTLRERGSRFSVFPVRDAPREGGAVRRLEQIPRPRTTTDRNRFDLAHHFADLARKECMQCHLYSTGRAVEGRVGFDGDYRGEGCAACHVPYTNDGLTRSRDVHAPRGEPGHPRTHEMTAAPDTDACARCHYGDASIGLNFRGLSQLPPGAPGGPDIPGTTDAQLNRTFYLSDPELTPPDVHHEAGMHCIDCHTANDVMGDGRLHGQMEYAVEISCEACHGTFDAPSDLRTERGTPLDHLRRVGEEIFLVSKVDGRSHKVPQVVHVLDPKRPEFNPRAREAMTAAHEGVECYTCHAGWNPNFFGFHFTRNESLTQLDLLTGKRTKGRVTTQEKVFATWKSFYAGLNEAGRVAPYLTGFSMMGSVYGEDGELVLDQVLPETAAGLSGMSMIHHQMHSVRPTARQCVECHRAPGTWGLGTPNFRLTRRLAFAVDRRGIEVFALRRESLSESVPLAKFVLPDVVDLALDSDELQGRARTLFAAEGGRGIHSLDVSDPTAPVRIGFVALAQPRALHFDAPFLYVAGGEGGLSVFDASDPAALELVGSLPTFDAHDVTVAWPWAYVADGPGGLLVCDVSVPLAPRVLAALDANGTSTLPNDVTHVATLFQYSRPLAEEGRPVDRRTGARHLAALLDQEQGLVLVDVTEPTAPALVYPDPERGSSGRQRDGISYRGLVLASHVDLAEAQGGSRTFERDYAYLLVERVRDDGEIRSELQAFDVSSPRRPKRVGRLPAGYATEALTPLSLYNPPFLQRVMVASGSRGAYATDVSVSAGPVQVGALPAIRRVYGLVAEEFPLDAMVRSDGRRLKDVSHAESRWLFRTEFERVLGLDAAELWGDAEPAPRFGGSALAHFTSYDRDDSGFLHGAEFEAAGGAAFDHDGDDRLSLLELAEKIGMLSSGRSEAPAPIVQALESRTGYDGDLARLLDGVNPWEFDEDEDARLDREEARRAMFHALDLDGDGALDPDEFSRAPGPPRQLRFRDEAGEAVLRRTDDNRDGKVVLREFELRDEEWEALDRSDAGHVTLAEGRVSREDRARGALPRDSEWPTRRVYWSGLPPIAETAEVLEQLDANGDGWLSRRELERRPELFRELDRNRDERVDAEEIGVAVERIARSGVEIVAETFVPRWDLDGDGEVGPDELPAWVADLLERRDAGR